MFFSFMLLLLLAAIVLAVGVIIGRAIYVTYRRRHGEKLRAEEPVDDKKMKTMDGVIPNENPDRDR